MKKLLATLVLAGLYQTAMAAGIQVEEPWARASVEGMKMSGAFMKINNDTNAQDFLVGGNSPVAERVEVHTHVNDNGVMRMREVKGGIPLPKKTETGQLPRHVHGPETAFERRRNRTGYAEIQKSQTHYRRRTG